ncbi:MAG: hypothetical protein HY094_10595 [Candidatus Melainabacteria bacterium]|nr:hypothetical protein [Candidatus Melainabacteria bacterium]
MSDLTVGQMGHPVSSVVRQAAGSSDFSTSKNTPELRPEQALNEQCSPAPITSLTTQVTNLIGSVSNVVFNLANSMFDSFKPLLNLISGVEEINGNSDAEITAGQFTTVLKDVLSKINTDENINRNLSSQSREELERLRATVSRLSERKDLQSEDITGLIQRWRSSRDTQAIFRMVAMLRNQEGNNGNNVQFTDEELRRAFVNGLESLALSLEEIMSHPPSEIRDQAQGHITQSLDHTVNAVERHHTRRGDLNHADREYICQELGSACRHAETVINDEGMSSCLGCSRQSLSDWTSYVQEFITSWFEEKAEEEREEEVKEEKEKAEKLCEERCEEKKLIEAMCRMHRVKRKIAEEFYSLMKQALSKIQGIIRVRDESNLNYHKDYRAESESRHYSRNYDYVRNKYREESASEQYYKNREDEIEDSLSPSYVCENIGMGNLELDLHC